MKHHQHRPLTPIIAMLIGSLLPAATVQADAVEYRLQAAETTQQLLKTLGGKLKQEMNSAGPVAAISVCKVAAPEIARDLSLETGWRVTRVSERVRNPLLGTPDAWESEQLASFASRHADGEPLGPMFSDDITSEGGRQYYRYMKALGMKPVCLTCHGDDDTVPAAVDEALRQEYPHDRARGYAAGDLRGAISIKRPLDD